LSADALRERLRTLLTPVKSRRERRDARPAYE
jgi:hypothetical protein